VKRNCLRGVLKRQVLLGLARGLSVLAMAPTGCIGYCPPFSFSILILDYNVRSEYWEIMKIMKRLTTDSDHQSTNILQESSSLTEIRVQEFSYIARALLGFPFLHSHCYSGMKKLSVHKRVSLSQVAYQNQYVSLTGSGSYGIVLRLFVSFRASISAFTF
jgi:hypothetical protein